MRVRVASRESGLAILQARKVAEALRRAHPHVTVEFIRRSARGDLDASAPLWQSAEKGLFTRDLTQLLLTGDADLVVHSWKDLPAESMPGTEVAGTLKRADPRDVLLVRRAIAASRPSHLRILTSSPRRAWQIQRSLAELLPWSIDRIEVIPVRGNVPTRLRKLLEGQGDGLVMAKAALDRMLAEADPAERELMRNGVDDLKWMILPLRDFPTAPAQGALAIEIAEARNDMRTLVSSISDEGTRRAVERERARLAEHGGGCHEAIGVTVLEREYGTVVSARGRLSDGSELREWTLESARPLPPPADAATIWPRPDERRAAVRHPRTVTLPRDTDGWWVARADAVPPGAQLDNGFVWAAGPRTWARLAARGIWVHGSSEGLGDTEDPAIDLLAGRPVRWCRLTHGGSDAPGAIATYDVELSLPDDLPGRTHFFWTSGSAFRDALRRFPTIRAGWHACGPGRTFRAIREALGETDRLSVWLDYEQWLEHVRR